MSSYGSFQQLGMLVMKVSRELLNNANLCKLLYYEDDDPFAQDPLTDTKELLFMKNINILPKIPKQEYNGCFINVIIDDIMSTSNNDFDMVSIRFDVLCPIDLWVINDTQLRPFAIMEEIDKYMRHSQKTTIGGMDSRVVKFIAPTESLAGYSLFYTGNEFR